jgi:hypothetical protein
MKKCFNGEQRIPLGGESMDLKKALQNDRVIRALIGMKVKAFRELSEGFYEIVKEVFREEREVNIDRGRPRKLKTGEEMLFFILLYMKCYPTFDLLGWMFELSASEACRWVHWLMPALKKHLGKELVLPERRISSVEEFFRMYPGVGRVFIDGTERTIQRPKSSERQKEYYSGKKKRHTVKNIVINDEKKRVLVVTETVEGKKHDKTAFLESGSLEHMPEEVAAVFDLGFQGIEKEKKGQKIVIPHKKPRGKELPEELKAENTAIARQRIVSEHTISAIKRYGAVSRVYRNHRPRFEDDLMLAACGLWNYYLKSA